MFATSARTGTYLPWILIASAPFTMAAPRVPLRLEVLHDRNQLYRETADGFIENVYTVKIINMDQRPHRYTLGVDGMDGARLVVDRGDIIVEPGQQLDFAARVQVPASPASRRRAAAPVQLLHRAFVVEQRRLQLNLAVEAIKVRCRAGAVLGHDLVASAIETDGVAKRQMEIQRQRPTRGARYCSSPKPG